MQIQPLDLSDGGARTEAICNNVMGGPMITLKQNIYGGYRDSNKVYLEKDDLIKLINWAVKNKLVQNPELDFIIKQD